jgi:hypothetical protein
MYSSTDEGHARIVQRVISEKRFFARHTPNHSPPPSPPQSPPPSLPSQSGPPPS